MYPENKIITESSVKPGPAPGSSLPQDYHLLIEKLKSEKSWRNGELASMVLLRGPARKMVLAIMHPGTEVNSFQADDSVTFRVIEGKMNLRTEKGSLILARGEVLTLRDKMKYVIDSIDESALLITLESYA